MDKSRKGGSGWVEAFRNKYFDRLYASTIYPPETTSMVSLGMYFTLELEERTIQRFFGCQPRTVEVVQPPNRESMRISGRPENEARVRRYARGHRSVYNLGRKSELWFEELQKREKRRSPAFALAIYDHQAGSFIPRPLKGADRFGDPEKMVLRYRDHLSIERDFLRLEA